MNVDRIERATLPVATRGGIRSGIDGPDGMPGMPDGGSCGGIVPGVPGGNAGAGISGGVLTTLIGGRSAVTTGAFGAATLPSVPCCGRFAIAVKMSPNS